MIRLLGLIAFVALLGGCAHDRPTEMAQCEINAYPLLVGGHHPRGDDTIPVRDTGNFDIERIENGKPKVPEPFQIALTRALAAGNRGSGTKSSDDAVLVLSGGGQHGPFGTGFFLGLPKVRTYRIVTGVSTGSLQSTFVFLARQPVPTPNDREYPLDTGNLDIPKGSSDIGDLALASSISSERSLLRIHSFGVVGGVLAGSISSLDPLAQRLYDIISRDTLGAVAAERAKGRSLFVGVVDVDDGNGYALDLTALAEQGAKAATEAGMDAARHCYVQALLASSSVPLAAYPVSIALHDMTQGAAAPPKRHLMIDGGARFGVFFRQMLDAVKTASTPAIPVDVDLIVNGSLYSTPWLDGRGKPVNRWSALTLGQRSLDILENQVYRFSVEQVESSTSGGRLRMAFISNENLGPTAPDPGDFVFRDKKCSEWSALDEQDYHVLQFHPRYMACLLAYGRDRGSHEQWNLDSLKIKAAP